MGKPRLLKIDAKTLFLKALYGRWGRCPSLEEGYTILLPMPSDMPFLLSYALEGLKHLDLAHCRQVLVVGDGMAADGGASLRAIVAGCGDPRVEMVRSGSVDRFVVTKLRGVGSSLHWLAIVQGTREARCETIFLHDSDAFFRTNDGIERQYREFLDRSLFTLGVTARWDALFREAGYQIPGTWEMMYGTRWARLHPPFSHKGRRETTPHGVHEFDTMLYPQYLDYRSGKVGVMADPPRLVHFNGTIVTYRAYQERQGRPVVDELFRLLLLAILENLLPPSHGKRVVPTVAELARGLTDPSAPVTYGTAAAAREFVTFRRLLDEMCDAPVMAGDRARRVREMIRPFDDHFAANPTSPREPLPVGARSNGLG